MAANAEQRQAVCPYLPPELWQRILFQHTHPKQLWTVGRQVCSTWRSEIPKLFARKYLEKPDLVQIWLDFDACIVAELVLDRYEGKNNERVVFKENPLTSGRDAASTDPRRQECEREKTETWDSRFRLYLWMETNPFY
jgi:hypothetical protein